MTVRSRALITAVVVGLCAQAHAQTRKTRGVPVAAITIEVFSDYQCPACRALYEQTVRPLITDYADKGKVYLIHRDFPLDQHRYAREAASYACAASHIGKYEPVCETLFRTQDQWSKTGQVEATVSSVLNAEELKRVKALAKTPEIAQEIAKDIELGRQAKLNQTPTMIVSHKGSKYPVSGAVSYPILRRFLDQLLNK